MDENHKGQGVAVIIRYPLAQNIINYNIIDGRIIRILFKRRKKSPISIYAIQLRRLHMVLEHKKLYKSPEKLK